MNPNAHTFIPKTPWVPKKGDIIEFLAYDQIWVLGKIIDKRPDNFTVKSLEENGSKNVVVSKSIKELRIPKKKI